MPNVNHDRPLRFAACIRQALTETMLSNNIDHTIATQLLTILSVDVSPDCRNVLITLSAITDQIDLQQAVAKLNQKNRYIAHLMRDKLSFRYLPSIKFQSLHDVP